MAHGAVEVLVCVLCVAAGGKVLFFLLQIKRFKNLNTSRGRVYGPWAPVGCLGRPICWLGFVPPALLASSFFFPDLLSPVPSARGGDFFRALQLQESNRIEIEFKAKARTGRLGFCGVPKSDGVQNRILAISRRDPPGKEGGIVVGFSCHVAASVAAAHPPAA